MYVSVKDATAATNTWTFSVGTTCGGIIGTYNIPITNAWPATAAGVYTVPIDFTGITTPGCGLGLILRGATKADQIRISYLAFAPVAEQFNAQTINATTINASTVNLPGGAISGGTPPTSNASSPHISLQGSGNPTITMGTVEILNGAGVPTGCGTTYGNGSIYSRTDGTHSGKSLLYVCDAATSTWVAFE